MCCRHPKPLQVPLQPGNLLLVSLTQLMLSQKYTRLRQRPPRTLRTVCSETAPHTQSLPVQTAPLPSSAITQPAGGAPLILNPPRSFGLNIPSVTSVPGPPRRALSRRSRSRLQFRVRGAPASRQRPPGCKHAHRCDDSRSARTCKSNNG